MQNRVLKSGKYIVSQVAGAREVAGIGHEIYFLDLEEWMKRVKWASEAEEYSIYGSYDDVCDAIHQIYYFKTTSGNQSVASQGEIYC